MYNSSSAQGPTLGVKCVILLGARIKSTSTTYKNSRHHPIPREQLLTPLVHMYRGIATTSAAVVVMSSKGTAYYAQK